MKDLKTPWWIPGHLQQSLYKNPRFEKYGGEEYMKIDALEELLSEWYKEDQVIAMMDKILPVIFSQDAILINLDETTGNIICLNTEGEILYCDSSCFRWKG